MLHENYQIRTILSDNWGTLDTALLEEGLVDELSLVVAPVLLRRDKNTPLPSFIGKKIGFKLKSCRASGDSYGHLVYEMIR